MSAASRLRWLVTRLVKDLLGRLALFTGAHRRLLRERGIIVAFHSITSAPGDGALRCGLDDFEAYCRFFARHLCCCCLSDLAERVRSGQPLEGRLAITFDDGYRDNAELAAPVLARHRLPATFYVTTGFIGSDRQAPWDLAAGVTSRWMSAGQVKALHEAGHDIGAHTRNHADLGALPEADAIAEIAGSVADIRAWTGVAPRHFAVPFGRAFPTLPRLSQLMRDQLGFETVTLCRNGLLNPACQNVAWERIPVAPNDYLSPYGWFFDVLRDVNRTFPEMA